jgi:beta-galactosidase
LSIVAESFVEQLQRSTAQVLIGPRSGSKTSHFSIPVDLPPGSLQRLLPLKVTRVESLREGMIEYGSNFAVHRWLEHVESSLPSEWTLDNGRGVLYRHQQVRYLAASLDPASMRRLLKTIAEEVGVRVCELTEDVRLRRLGSLCFAFNYSTGTRSIGEVLPKGTPMLLGSVELAPADVAVWME